MKKILSIIAMLSIICANVILSASEETSTQFSIADKIRSFMLSNNPIALDSVQETYDNTKIRGITSQLNHRKMQGYTDEELKKLYNRFMKQDILNPEYSFYFYPLHTLRYAKQYADTFNFDELVSDEKIWTAVINGVGNKKVSEFSTKVKDSDFSEMRELQLVRICDDETIEFLQNPEAIEQMTNNEIDEQILDCKIVVLRFLWISPDGEYKDLTNAGTILYLKGENTDYGIKIYTGSGRLRDPINLENFKLYTMAEILQNCASYAQEPHLEMVDQKPTYAAEAEALQAEGLLNGNERGLDLLKPLTRIEATTILVRALGLENEQTSPVSQFTDIPSENWGAKYANIAADHGITKGIGENQFAPDDLVTDNQFATLVLRSANASTFDWQEAINILIEREIITAEQASTMDLFTRGDMAKIIYEAKQKGLIQ